MYSNIFLNLLPFLINGYSGCGCDIIRHNGINLLLSKQIIIHARQLFIIISDVPLSPRDNYQPKLRHPSSHQLLTKDLQLKTCDNITIRGWHVKQEAPQRLIIYFHENARNIGFRIPLVKSLSQKTNSDVILVAYRGYSDSQGVPTQQGLQNDARAVLDYALDYSEKNLNNELKVFLYGRSIGAAVSIYIGSHDNYKNKIAGLILQNTFTSIKDVLQTFIPIYKHVKFLQRNFWPSIERIPNIKKPILFFVSLKDDICSQMKKLISKVDRNVYYQEHQLKNATSNNLVELDKLEEDKYFNRICQFFKHHKVTGMQKSKQ